MTTGMIVVDEAHRVRSEKSGFISNILHRYRAEELTEEDSDVENAHPPVRYMLLSGRPMTTSPDSIQIYIDIAKRQISWLNESKALTTEASEAQNSIFWNGTREMSNLPIQQR